MAEGVDNGSPPVDDAAQPQADNGGAGSRPGRWRRGVAWAGSGLAGLFVLFALNAPNDLDRLDPQALLRIPVEGLVAAAVLLVVPARARRPVAMGIGVILGLLTVVKLVDMGFYAVLDRPFDPVVDETLMDAAWTFVIESYGQFGGFLAAMVVAALGVAVLVLLPVSVLRLTRLLVLRRTAALRSVAVLGVATLAAALLGVQVIPEVPVSSFAYDHVREAQASFEDRRVFAEAIADDAFRDMPADQLLTGLRGKDVLIAFVESYGRDVVEDPEFAPEMGAVLDAGNRRLQAAGFASRSAFLTSPTAGGSSWLAHASLLSGLWVDDQQRYDMLVRSDRLTLGSAFRRADWRTVGVMPGVRWDWPQGSSFFGYDHIYGATNVGYQGPKFRWASMPDQYALSLFERTERARPDRAPVMAELSLVSSHVPWTEIPRFVDWDEVGDGSVFHTTGTANEDSGESIWSDSGRVRDAYQQAIEYSLTTLISYVETYGDRDLVLMFLGDHQPGRVITGAGASRDVPVTIIAGDPAVLDRISGWGWEDGMHPSPQAPVWPMDAFRDQFLTAFGAAASPDPTPDAPAR
jgi:hypothetical protein